MIFDVTLVVHVGRQFVYVPLKRYDNLGDATVHLAWQRARNTRQDYTFYVVQKG